MILQCESYKTFTNPEVKSNYRDRIFGCWVDGWMDGRTDGRTDGHTDEHTDIRMNSWMDGRVN